MPKTLDIAKI
jgi:chromosome segregation ATPase